MTGIHETDGKAHALKELAISQNGEVPRRVYDLLAAHGISVRDTPTAHILTFPDGTTRTHLGLRTQCEYYKILLPDGLELCEVYDRDQNKNCLKLVSRLEGWSN
jgi:hypothetical protein